MKKTRKSGKTSFSDASTRRNRFVATLNDFTAVPKHNLLQSAEPQSFAELLDLWKKRVDLDRSILGVDCEFLPNPEICTRPSYCLIGMEPSVKIGGLKQLREQLPRGFKNFLTSEEDFIVHYCVYHFLCNSSFSYQITDLAKGAMTTEDARATAKERYPQWLSLLRYELKLLGDPVTIIIGKVLEQHLSGLGFVGNHCIPHYSWSGSKWLKVGYNRQRETNSEIAPSDLRMFADNLLRHVGYSEDMRRERLQRIFQSSKLSPWRKRLFNIYQALFRQIASGDKLLPT